MKYMGSKSRIQKYIIPIMTKNRTPDMIFYDSFCGGQNLIDKVTGKRVASDINEYLIEQLKLIRDNPISLPKNNREFTKEDYLDVKNNIDRYDKYFVGYVGFALSLWWMWFQCLVDKIILDQDYVMNLIDALSIPIFQVIHFVLNLLMIFIFRKCIIYLDRHIKILFIHS